MDGSMSSLVSPNIYQVHTNGAPQLNGPLEDRCPSADLDVNCRVIGSENKERNSRGALNMVSQTTELNANIPINGLISAPTNRVDSNTIVIGEHVEGCVVVDLHGNMVVKQSPSVQTQSAPYLINEQVLVHVSKGEQTVQALPSSLSELVPATTKGNQDSVSINTNSTVTSEVTDVREISEQHPNSNLSMHMKPGVIFESRFPSICLPQGPEKEGLGIKLEAGEEGGRMPKRKSAKRARLKLQDVKEDDNVIRKINSSRKRKHYTLSSSDQEKTTNDKSVETEVADVPVWARYLRSVRILEDKWISGIAPSKKILHQILEGHSRSILCDYIKSHPSNFEKRRNAKSQESRVMWKHKQIMFDGVPFTLVSSNDLKCTYGMNYKIKRKDTNKFQKGATEEEDFENEDDDQKITKVSKDVVKGKKKLASKISTTPKKKYKDIMFTSCPAKIKVNVLIKYPGYAVPPFALRKERKVMLKALRSDLSQQLDVEKEELYCVTLPLRSVHNHPFTGRSRNIHPSIITKIKGLVQEGVTYPKLIKSVLDTHVQMEHGQDMVTPHPDDRAYYPKMKDIGNLVYNYCKKMGIPRKRKNLIGSPLERSIRETKRHKKALIEGGHEKECRESSIADNGDVGITDNLPLQASTLQEAVRTFCTDESDGGNIVVAEQECAGSSTLMQHTSSDVASLADMVRGQLDSLRNLTYSIGEINSLQDIYQSLQVLLNQYTNINPPSIQGAVSNPSAPAAAAFIIHESVIDPISAGGEAPMQTTAVPESDQNSLAVPERDANGIAMTSKYRNAQIIESPHLRQFRQPVAVQCLTTNVVPSLAMSQLPRTSHLTSEQGVTHCATNPDSTSLTQPTYQTLAPAPHDAPAVPVQLSLPPYFYYVQEVTVAETSSTNSTVNTR